MIQSWYPERFVGDLAFIGGSQDSFSLFSYLYKPAIRIFGVHDAALLISATSLLFWGIAVALLIKAINKKWTAAIFIFLASFELSYGPTNWLRFGEFLCTSRTLTEALAILGFLFLFKNQKKKSFALFFAGTLMHPLIAGWGLLIWSFVYYPKTVIPVGLFSLFFPLTVFIGKLPFAAFDPVWADAAKEFAWNPYKMGRAAAYFAIVFCASRIFFQAQRKMWNGILITALIAYYWTFAGVFLKHVFLTQVQPWRAEWILMLFSLIFTGHTFLTALQWKHFKKIFKLQPVLLSVIGLAAIYLVFFNLHGQQNLLKYNGGITSLFYTCPRLSLFLLSFAACLVLKRSKWKLIVYAYALGLAAFAVYLTSSADFESSEASRQLDIFLKEKEAPFAQSVRGDYAHLLYAMPQMTERVFWATGSYYGTNSFYSMSEERFSTTRHRIAKILNEQDVLTKPFVYPYSWYFVGQLLDNPKSRENM
ncbi:MAG: hypothetical protein M0P13_11420, partial [Fibrobacteraceae bacterium]|nr:hypothetical protein [Fibrobacteraceae bacterium]